jgi:uncharacterized integral membrane protein
MRKFFTALVLVPLGVIFVVFAVANRHEVRVSFDPFNAADPAISLVLPLFALIIAVAILGVVAGGTATWFGQRRWRRAARQHQADARAAQARFEELRSRTTTVPRSNPQRLPAPHPGAGFGAGGRDKYGATL